MALIKLGKLILSSDLRNSDDKYGEDSVVGISTQKEMITTKANLDGVKLTSYKLLPTGYFAYVADTSRRGDKIALCYNNTENTYLISSIYTTFFVSNKELLDPKYLYMYFNRPEFDRYSRYNSWGSARETFDWVDFCDIEIDLPPLEIQKKYVAIYEAMLANQRSYERGLEDLKLVCDAYIEELKRNNSLQKLKKYIIPCDCRNENLQYEVDAVRGLAVSKGMIETKANMDGVSLKGYKLVPPRHIAYVSDTSRRGDKMSLGFNDSQETYLVSSISTVFTTDTKFLIPEYLMLFFCRAEFDRYARFHSWGSARETFDWEEMCDVEIPVPSIEIQKDVVDIFHVYNERKTINETLKAQIKDICPILIKGSIEEAKKGA